MSLKFIALLLNDFFEFGLGAAQLHAGVAFGNSHIAPDLLVGIAFEMVKHQCFFNLVELVQRLVKMVELQFFYIRIFIGVADVIGCDFIPVRFFLFLLEKRDRGVDGHAVHPGRKLAFAAVRTVNFPQLADHFLEQIFLVVAVVHVHFGDLVQDSLVRFDAGEKFRFVGFQLDFAGGLDDKIRTSSDWAIGDCS